METLHGAALGRLQSPSRHRYDERLLVSKKSTRRFAPTTTPGNCVDRSDRSYWLPDRPTARLRTIGGVPKRCCSPRSCSFPLTLHVPPLPLLTTTEPCASVTSAFLQILATIHNVEACRVSKPRNILSILSTNTRRTKVVEMSTGTHRVVRRHSISFSLYFFLPVPPSTALLHYSHARTRSLLLSPMYRLTTSAGTRCPTGRYVALLVNSR